MKNRRLWGIAARIAFDVATAGLSLAAGFAARFWIALFEPHPLEPPELLRIFVSTYLAQGPLLAAALVGTFAASGVYTRTRFYTRRLKAVTLFQAISLAYAVFLALVYVSGWAEAWIPRGTFLIAYALTLALGMGPRLAKQYFEGRFIVEAARPAPERPVRKVLLVGGAGYIGSVLARDLLADGYTVRVLDSLLYGDESIRALYSHPGFHLVRGDLRHVATVVQAAKGIDAVIHLAAIVGDPACALDEDETLETNLVATRLLADVCRASGVSRILFASTCSVYGSADHLVDERSRLNPVSLYAATKIDSERVLLGAASRHFHPVIFRLATAFGFSFRPRFDLVVNLLAARATAEKRILIFNGEQWRPFIHVSDISRVFRQALAAPLELVSGEIFNAGSSSMNFTLRQVAEQIAAIEPALEVEYADNADKRNYRVGFDKIRSRLGFECRTGLAAGVREIRDAIARGEVLDYRDPRYSNVQLISRRLEEAARGPGPNGNGETELTALQFARNSLWWRAVTAGGSGEELLRATSLVALARAVDQAQVSRPGTETQRKT